MILFGNDRAYRDVEKLKEALDGVIPIRNSKTRSVIPSNYIRRLSRITNHQYKQKKGKTIFKSWGKCFKILSSAIEPYKNFTR